MLRQKVLGYNNDSGLMYKSCGMSQYEGKLELPVDEYDTAEYENKQNVNKTLDLMNDGLDLEKASQAPKPKEQAEIELKADPSQGEEPYRISKAELFPQRVSVQVMKNNYELGRPLPKLPKSKSINKIISQY